MENPLLIYKNDTNDSFIRFDLIKDEHFEPAFEVALATAKSNLQKLIDNPEVPTFENTIEALEYISEDLDRISAIFFDLKESNTNEVLDTLAKKISPILADYSNDISLNKKLFDRVRSVYESNPVLKTKEKERLLQKTFNWLKRSGAMLSDDEKELVREYDKELALTTQLFSENLLASTNSYELHITEEKDLSGIPERVRDMANIEAISRGKNGWVFTLNYTSFGPFLQYAGNPKLRKDIYLSFIGRGMKEPFDNRQIVLKITKLRKKLANILGYPSHAHFVLADRMARTPENVNNFFSTLYQASRALAEKDFEIIRSYKTSITGELELYPWDLAYYSEKVKKEQFDFDEELLRPYLKLDYVIEGVFKHADMLYGISFLEKSDIPVYHSDVKVFEARKDNKYLGLLYLDLFPRDSKRNGAWADVLRPQNKRDGIDRRANVVIVASLTKPTNNAPSLLTSDETLTIFHEFGHALHVLLSDCEYKSLSGYNVLWDFCELPSQLMQSWLMRKESFDIFAKHYKTGETIHEELLKSLLKSDRFMGAWDMLRQLGASVLDMAWHGEDADTIFSIEDFEEKTRAPYNLFNKLWSGTSISTSFSHIFGANAGYSAGYYSYHWAEVLAADAFEYFKEEGLFSKEIAEKFRENILSKGNSEEPLDLYRKFRGRDADPKALFRHKGLL
jgi:peptidyl-dipeptidase Dcp